MSFNMQSIWTIVGSFSIVASLLTFSFDLVGALHVSSMIAHLDAEATNYPTTLDIGPTDQLKAKSGIFVKPFEKLITKLARPDKTACDLEAELRLLSASRSIEDYAADSAHNGDLLEAVKSLYGIRKAICETGIGSTQLPGACHKLIPTTDLHASRKQMTMAEVYLANSGAVPACLQRFREHHYLWTSYSNNRQDANSMLHLLRSDVEMRNIVMTYRDFEVSMSGFRDEFETMRAETSNWYSQAYHNAQGLFGMQDKAFESFHSGFGNVSSTVMHDLASINDILEESHTVLQKLSVTASVDISNINQEISFMIDGLAKMKDAMAQIYSNAAVEAAVLTKSHFDAAQAMFDVLEAKSGALGEGLEEIVSGIYQMQSFFSQLDEVHSRNLDRIEEQYELAGLVLDKQRASSDLIDHIYNIVERLSSDTQDLSTTVTSITYLIALVQQYGEVLVAVCIYAVLSAVMAPLSGTIIPRGVVKGVKTGFWALRAAMFLYQRIDLSNLPKFSKHTQILLISFVAAAYSTTLIAYCLSLTSKRSAMRTFDLEQAPIDRHNKIRYRRYVSEGQRRRLRSPPRNARCSTAPPGL